MLSKRLAATYVHCVLIYSYSLVIFAFSKPFNLIILELDNIEENKLIYKKVLNSAFEKKKRSLG